jgi:acyl homoserine lactone synthase
MIQILIGRTSELPSGLDATLAQYRHKVFVERLGWQLPVETGVVGQERDQFDRSDTIYVVGRTPEGEICGCARLLPTTGPYLLGEVFPHLLAGQWVYGAPDVWELSRFAAVSGGQDSETIAEGRTNARTLFAAAVACAAKHGIRRLISVTYISMERWLRRMGVHVHRAGPSAIVDGEPVCACWIEIDDETFRALGIETDPVIHAPSSPWRQ